MKLGRTHAHFRPMILPAKVHRSTSSSPLAALTDDTDGDGVTDDVELAAGTDALDRLDVPSVPVPEFGAGGLIVLVMTLGELGRRGLRARAARTR